LALCLFERASFFVRFKWPFLRPGLLPGRRRAQGLSRRPQAPRSGLVLIAPRKAPCLEREGLHSSGAWFPFSFPALGSWFSGSAKLPQHGCGAGAAMSRTRSPAKGPATEEARSPEPRPSGTEIKLWNLEVMPVCEGAAGPYYNQDAAFPSAMKLLPSAHIRIMMTANLRATATLARRLPMRLASASPHVFKAEVRE
jgi:hypothetical protein